MNRTLCRVMQSMIYLTLLAMLTACGLDNNGTQSVVIQGDIPDDKIVLDVWHLWITEDDGNAIAFNKALEAYEKVHPEVEIREDSTENEAYKTKIKTAFSVNEAPDVFFSWGAGFAKSLVEAGLVEEITEHLSEDALENLHMNAVNNFTYGDKLYGLPFVSWIGILYCNVEMFEEADIKIPETINELFIAIELFREKGIVPMSVGAKDTWAAALYQNAATMRTAGVVRSEGALSKEMSFDRKPFVDGAQMVIDLVENEAFDASCLAFTYDEAKVAFLSGEVPMIYQGSWMAAEIQNTEFSDVVGKVVAKNFPAIKGGAYNNQYLGGAIDGLMMSSMSENKEEAAEFIAFITEYMAKESFIQGSGIPVWEIDTSGEEIDSLVKQIVDLAGEADGFILAWDTYLSGDDVSWHLALIQELFAGIITADEFAEKMQKLNEAIE